MLPGLLFGVLSVCVWVVQAEAPFTCKRMMHIPHVSADIEVWHKTIFVCTVAEPAYEQDSFCVPVTAGVMGLFFLDVQLLDVVSQLMWGVLFCVWC